MRANDACIGKEDVETAVTLEGIVHDFLDGLLVGSVKLPCVHLDIGPCGFDVLLVRREVGVVIIADVDCSGPVLSELKGGSSANSENRVCALELVRFKNLSSFPSARKGTEGGSYL